MGREEMRRKRLTEIYGMIETQTNKKGIDKKKLIAECCFVWGVARRKMLEYINIMIDSERVLEVDGILWLKN